MVVVRFNHIPSIRRDAAANGSRLIRAIGTATERYVKESMGTSPSRPGDPPGVDTGALRASIHVEMTDALTALVSDGVPYGVFLEFGTTRMGARPFMVPALLWAAGQVPRIAREIEWGA